MQQLSVSQKIEGWMLGSNWKRLRNPNCFQHVILGELLYVYEDHMLHYPEAGVWKHTRHPLPETETALFNIIPQ